MPCSEENATLQLKVELEKSVNVQGARCRCGVQLAVRAMFKGEGMYNVITRGVCYCLPNFALSENVMKLRPISAKYVFCGWFCVDCRRWPFVTRRKANRDVVHKDSQTSRLRFACMKRYERRPAPGSWKSCHIVLSCSS